MVPEISNPAITQSRARASPCLCHNYTSSSPPSWTTHSHALTGVVLVLSKITVWISLLPTLYIQLCPYRCGPGTQQGHSIDIITSLTTHSHALTGVVLVLSEVTVINNYHYQLTQVLIKINSFYYSAYISCTNIAKTGNLHLL